MCRKVAREFVEQVDQWPWRTSGMGPRDLADTGLVRRWQFRDEYDLDQCLTHLAELFRRKREAAPMPLPQIFGKAVTTFLITHIRPP